MHFDLTDLRLFAAVVESPSEDFMKDCRAF
jgi:hypothetical protein